MFNSQFSECSINDGRNGAGEHEMGEKMDHSIKFTSHSLCDRIHSVKSHSQFVVIVI
jgi:hypothetical protein